MSGEHSKVVLVAVVAGVIVLMHLGLCPLTLQLLMLGVVAYALYRRTSIRAERRVLEKFTGSSTDQAPVDPLPKSDKVVCDVPASGASIEGTSDIPDGAGGSWTMESPNPKSDAVVVRAPITGSLSSKDAGVFEDFTVMCTAKIPASGAITILKVDGTVGSELSSLKLAVQASSPGLRQLKLSIGPGFVSCDVTASKAAVTIFARRTGNIVTLTQVIGEDAETYSAALPEGSRILPEVIKPVIIGDGVAGGDVELTKLVVWSTSLADVDVLALSQKAWEAQLLKEEYVAGLVASKNEAMKTAMDARTVNPYGSDVIQRECSAVKDWTLPDALANADAACWAAISAQCETHPEGPGCSCWDPIKATTASCQKFRAQLSGSVPVNLASLTADQLETVKQTYGLAVPTEYHHRRRAQEVHQDVRQNNSHYKKHSSKHKQPSKPKFWWEYLVGRA